MASYYDSETYAQVQSAAMERARKSREAGPYVKGRTPRGTGTPSVGPASFGGSIPDTQYFSTSNYRSSYADVGGWGGSDVGWSGTKGMGIQDLISKFQKDADQANVENIKRYEEAMGIYEDIEAMYQPGGAFETSAMSMLERQRTKDLASAAQAGVTSGLSQTTRQQFASQRYTEDVMTPATIQIQAQAQQALAKAKGQRAQFIERREDVGPDYTTIAQLAMAASS